MSASHKADHSVSHLIKNLSLNPDMVELDIRKSADGIIFCHHGSVPFGALYAQTVFGRSSFQSVLQRFPEIKTVDKMLSIIPDSVMIMLDVKQKNITPEDTAKIVNDYPRKQFWINAPTLRRLKSVRRKIGNKCLYTTGYPLLFHFTSYRKIVGWVDVVPLFFWQTNPWFLNKLKSVGVDYSIARWFISQKQREEIGHKIDSAWIYYRDVPSEEKYRKKTGRKTHE
jgi:hypothetical protein